MYSYIMSLKYDGSRILQEVLNDDTEEHFIVPNARNLPRYKYNPDHDNAGEWKTYHSKNYYRMKKKSQYTKRQRKAIV